MKKFEIELNEGDVYCAWLHKGKLWHKRAETKPSIAKDDVKIIFKILARGGIVRMKKEGYLSGRMLIK